MAQNVQTKPETALIIGNGPSVDRLDPSLLPHFWTYGCNHIGKKFSDWGRPTDNIVITDFKRTSEIGTAYKDYAGSVYVGNERRTFPNVAWTESVMGRPVTPLRQLVKPKLARYEFLDKLEFHYFLHPLIFDKLRFTFDLKKGLNFGYSVVTSAIQLAVIEGFKRIVLTGVDASYPTEKAYFKGMEQDVQWVNTPFIENPRMWMEPVLVCMQIALEGSGVEIIDCTPGGKLQFIKKGTLEDYVK